MHCHRLNYYMGRSLVATGLWILTPIAMGCGPTIFADTAALVVAGELPPPPPEPEPEPKRVEVTADKIVIHDKIHFEFNKADIKPDSFGLLNEIVSVIKEHPHIRQLSIEGHTDNIGTDRFNLKLSDARAASVRSYLTEHGIVGDMLLSKGWGEASPIAENESEDGRAKNRRVEFIITQQDEIKKTILVDPKTGQEVQAQLGTEVAQ